MPYSTEHKQATRARIVECARQLFNRKGFSDVSIDEIMRKAALTRGGFYNHFESKDELYVEAVTAYSHCNPADRWDGVELDFSAGNRALARQMVRAYLSQEHLEDTDSHCPMIALPSDTARAGPRVRAAFEAILANMVAIFEAAGGARSARRRRKRALGLVSLAVGGMVLARTVNDATLANELRIAARDLALELCED